MDQVWAVSIFAKAFVWLKFKYDNKIQQITPIKMLGLVNAWLQVSKPKDSQELLANAHYYCSEIKPELKNKGLTGFLRNYTIFGTNSDLDTLRQIIGK